MKKLLKSAVALLLVICVLLSAAVGVFAADGKWIKSGSRWWYRHTDSTYTANGWEKIGKSWYHFDKDGWMQTGWLKDGGNWYYLSDSGAMKTGWLKSAGKWYYLASSGAMVTGWKSIKSVWYFFEKSGAMHTGWLDRSDGRYFLDKSGAMQTGWLDYGGERYFLEKTGKMKTGWYKENGNWYYLDASSSGAMVTGQIVLGHNVYYFDSDGVYIGFERIEVEKEWYTFANDDRLNEHYEKHGIEMGYVSAADYLAGANAVINNPNALVKNGSENDTIYFVEATNEIVFLSQYGKIRTYFICSGKDYFDKQ